MSASTADQPSSRSKRGSKTTTSQDGSSTESALNATLPSQSPAPSTILNLNDLTEEWIKTWNEVVSKEEELSGVHADNWRVSKKTKTKANPDGEDLTWWRDNGIKQVEAYINWFKETKEMFCWDIAILPDGSPAIEWGATVFFGGMPVQFYIDAIYEDGAGELVVVDYKSGASTPIGFEQLGLYASAVEKIYGIRPKYGAFYSTRKAALEEVVELSTWSIEYFDHLFAGMQAQIQTGYFLPNVGMNCNMCGVRDACYAWGSENSKRFPIQVITHK